MANRCFLCHEKEETIDRLLLHCTKTRVIWICSLLCLGCHGCCLPQLERLSLVGMVLLWAKSAKKVWRAAPLHIFWTEWKVRNRLAFNDDVLSIQRLKYFFVFSLWSEAKLFIVDYPLTIVSFINWLGSS